MGQGVLGHFETGRKVRFYKITRAGAKQLEAEASDYDRLTSHSGNPAESVRGQRSESPAPYPLPLSIAADSTTSCGGDGSFIADGREERRRPPRQCAALGEESREAWGFARLDRPGDPRHVPRDAPSPDSPPRRLHSIGIGATVAAFSAFNMVVLRPLPIRDPDSIARVGRHAPTRNDSACSARSTANTRARSPAVLPLRRPVSASTAPTDRRARS